MKQSIVSMFRCYLAALVKEPKWLLPAAFVLHCPSGRRETTRGRFFRAMEGNLCGARHIAPGSPLSIKENDNILVSVPAANSNIGIIITASEILGYNFNSAIGDTAARGTLTNDMDDITHVWESSTASTMWFGIVTIVYRKRCKRSRDHSYFISKEAT